VIGTKTEADADSPAADERGEGDGGADREPAGNPVERVLRRIDAFQQRSPVLSPAFGVIRKFGDDRGPSLSALLAYYGFLSLFPLLLILTTILGFVGNERLEESILGTTLQQFPVVGRQIGRDVTQPLKGSGMALVVGLLGLLYGSLGVTQVAQRAMADVWNVPNVVRPGFVPRLGRSFGFLLAMLLGLAATTGFSGLATATGTGFVTRVVSLVGVTALDVVLCSVLFRVLTPKQVRWRQLWPGAVVCGVGYSILLALGTGLVQHQLRNAEDLYGQFGFVLGLIGWLYLTSQITLYAAEINVVLARRLWPRSILQPPLTDADERVLEAIAVQEERRPEQNVDVAFEDPTTDAPVGDDEASRETSAPT
jgi:YihY family inner membrane protein